MLDSPSAISTDLAFQFAVLAFNPGNQLAIRHAGTRKGLAFVGSDLAMATARLEAHFKAHTPITEYFSFESNGLGYRVYFTQVDGTPADHEVEFVSLETLFATTTSLAPSLVQALNRLDPYLIAIPYLHLGENDFIYKFRVEKDRNRSIYGMDDAAKALYQSKLCEALKVLSRQHERTATQPSSLDFGAIRYVIPSHFGFCLGVKNAIERAYETLAENPGKRVFMLSELIHNCHHTCLRSNG